MVDPGAGASSSRNHLRLSYSEHEDHLKCLNKRQDTNAPKIRILSIWFGANDACVPPSRQHVPLDKFVSNLTHFIQMVHSPASDYYSPDTRILLLTPPPINHFQREDDKDRVFDVTAKYAQAVRDVGAKENIPVV